MPTGLIEFATTKLMNLARLASKIGAKKILLLGPIVPLVKEYGEDTPKALWKRKEIDATHKERTQLVKDFNLTLKRKSRNNKFLYVDINDILLDPNTGVAKEQYQNKINHHLGINVAIKLWIPRIHKLLQNED